MFIIIALLSAATILLLLKRGERLAKGLLVGGVLLLFLLSFQPFSLFLVEGLEGRYPPLREFKGDKEVKYIVVLTAADTHNGTVPYTSNLGYRSAARSLEADRIYRKLPNCKIIISGSRDGGRWMSLFLELLGVPETQISVDHAADTFQSAENLKGFLDGKRFFLVTSAVHLPRAMMAFHQEGLVPVPAPGDFSYGYYPKYRFPYPRPLVYYLPSMGSFERSNFALHEYFGIVWYYLKALVGA